MTTSLLDADACITAVFFVALFHMSAMSTAEGSTARSVCAG
eukprot:CAMPEP_0203912394 /NCGR_PEP_ID=MMETSP0359-20131031/53478_1 /ASSEMBLY_ACC=CAM_ASM_000338 /TAXON_ID=268821 /ORGANISM="Scrippsiella Hangoei, Strain SHTV-5" /LENGTH=40 /DNA_ID= /DNA_START= /DNA_END= /DNA_ORIENTATION=